MLVKKVVKPKEGYQCEKCGSAYSTLEEALQCEGNTISPFKYEINDIVKFISASSHYLHSLSIPTGVIKERWIHGLPRKDEQAHGNVYKLQIIAGKGKGLIVRRFEDEIIEKVGKHSGQP